MACGSASCCTGHAWQPAAQQLLLDTDKHQNCRCSRAASLRIGCHQGARHVVEALTCRDIKGGSVSILCLPLHPAARAVPRLGPGSPLGSCSCVQLCPVASSHLLQLPAASTAQTASAAKPCCTTRIMAQRDAGHVCGGLNPANSVSVNAHPVNAPSA